MHRVALTSLLLTTLSLPAAGQRRKPYFPASQPHPYYYSPKSTPSVFGPRIVEIRQRVRGAGRSYYRGGFYGTGHHRPAYGYRPGYGYGYRRGYGYGVSSRYRSPYTAPYRRYSEPHPFGRYGRTGVYRFFVFSPSSGAIVQANSADLVIDVNPTRALIFIDGKLVGSGRDFARDREGYPLMEGEYELRVEHPGYEPFSTVLQIVPDRTVHLNLELTSLGEP